MNSARPLTARETVAMLKAGEPLPAGELEQIGAILLMEQAPVLGGMELNREARRENRLPRKQSGLASLVLLALGVLIGLLWRAA